MLPIEHWKIIFTISEYTGNNIICVDTINEAFSTVVDEPARDIDTMLGIISVVFLPSPKTENTKQYI